MVLVSTVQYTSVSHCSLNFERPHLGYGFLSIILVLEKCNLDLSKVLEFCTMSLLQSLLITSLYSSVYLSALALHAVLALFSNVVNYVWSSLTT